MKDLQQARQQMRKDALAILKAGLDAVDPVRCIQQTCCLKDNTFQVGSRCFNLDHFNSVVVIGAGKASATMAGAVENILQDRIDTGLIVTKYEHGIILKKVKVIEAGHPIPDYQGLGGAEELMARAISADDKTLVVCLLSGGGSALTPLPAKGILLEDKERTTNALLRCGATIHEINTIRKHLSRIKGGLLAEAVFPATMVCLVVSDVVGNDLSTIASGPAVPDATTFGDCLKIIRSHGIENLLPGNVLDHLKNGAAGLLPETPKPGNPLFDGIHHEILSENMTALCAAEKMASQLGYNSLILSSMIEGETKEVAKVHCGIAKEIIRSGHPVRLPACLVSGGETTVTLEGNGLGGRNQEFALACAKEIDGIENVVALSCGTDGTDGPTDAGGGLVDYTTASRAKHLGLDLGSHLSNNNAYPFLDQLGDLVKTGPTMTNVMDLRLLLIQ